MLEEVNLDIYSWLVQKKRSTRNNANINSPNLMVERGRRKVSGFLISNVEHLQLDLLLEMFQLNLPCLQRRIVRYRS